MMPKSHRFVPWKSSGADVKVSAGEGAIRHTDKKKEGVGVVRKISKIQDTDLIIHNKTGQIGQKEG